MKIKIPFKEMRAMLEWLGIIALAGLVIWWSFRGKTSGQSCSGCGACPLECSRRNIESKEESAK